MEGNTNPSHGGALPSAGSSMRVREGHRPVLGGPAKGPSYGSKGPQRGPAAGERRATRSRALRCGVGRGGRLAGEAEAVVADCDRAALRGEEEQVRRVEEPAQA
jgi:hypothetical protein